MDAEYTQILGLGNHLAAICGSKYPGMGLRKLCDLSEKLRLWIGCAASPALRPGSSPLRGSHKGTKSTELVGQHFAVFVNFVVK